MSESNGFSITYAAHAGDFRAEIGSVALDDELKNADDIDTFLKLNKKNMIPHNLPIHLDMLLREKGLRKADVVRDSGLDRKYLYQIFSGEKTPSRDKLIALAFGLHLTDEEAQTMLKVSGNRELYVRDERDIIILFALRKKMNISEVNGLLFNHGFDLLGSSEK